MTIEVHYTVTRKAEKLANAGAKGKLTFSNTQNGKRVWMEPVRFVADKKAARQAIAEYGTQFKAWNF